MTVQRKRASGVATSTAKISSGPAARSAKTAGGELADRDLDKVSGGPTAVERTPPQT